MRRLFARERRLRAWRWASFAARDGSPTALRRYLSGAWPYISQDILPIPRFSALLHFTQVSGMRMRMRHAFRADRVVTFNTTMFSQRDALLAAASRHAKYGLLISAIYSSRAACHHARHNRRYRGGRAHEPKNRQWAAE